MSSVVMRKLNRTRLQFSKAFLLTCATSALLQEGMTQSARSEATTWFIESLWAMASQLGVEIAEFSCAILAFVTFADQLRTSFFDPAESGGSHVLSLALCISVLSLLILQWSREAQPEVEGWAAGVSGSLQDLDTQANKALASIFEPAGLERSDLERLNTEAGGRLLALPTGTSASSALAEGQLALIVSGTLHAQFVASTGSVRTADLGAGTFLGGAGSRCIAHQPALSTSNMPLAGTDSVLLCWDTQRLEKLLGSDEQLREQVNALFAVQPHWAVGSTALQSSGGSYWIRSAGATRASGFERWVH